MRSLVIATALVIFSAAAACAGDTAISKSTLHSMGLGGMQQMTDHDGLAVRGKGTFGDFGFNFPQANGFHGLDFFNHFPSHLPANTQFTNFAGVPGSFIGSFGSGLFVH